MGLTTQSNDHSLNCVTADVEEVVSSVSWIESHPVTTVGIDTLVFDDSPRRGGEDPQHIRLLAEAGDSLPPITVHRPTMRVIDGIHRVRASLLNHKTTIKARLLDCDETAAFVLAVKANVTHGLPLSPADRAAAAARIITYHPQWSDRAVAAAAGLSDKTVSRIRCRSTAENPQSNTRIGRDGRLRPLDSGLKRQQAAAIITDHPDAGLREIARATGLSAATVRDVRQRINRGEDPVPRRYRTPTKLPTTPLTPLTHPPTTPTHHNRPRRTPPPADRHTLLARLRHDPSLRFNEAGRQTLRWLHHHTVDTEGLETLGRALPDHWAPVVAGLARSCATAWNGLAEQLEQRIQ